MTFRKASAVELMVVDALLAAEPVLKLAEKTEDSREFAKLDDTVLRVRAPLQKRGQLFMPLGDPGPWGSARSTGSAASLS